MRWIEIIHVRAYTKASREQALREARVLSLTLAPQALDTVTLWIRADLETDVGILLIWIEDVERRTYSPLGLRIADDFSQFGWVDHSVWMDAGTALTQGEAHRAS